MKTFFIIVALLGALMAWLDQSAMKYPDSIPTELTGGTGLGIVLVIIGVIGFLCVKFFP